MRAVVLVGGLGTRLRPLTNRTPKQMLPVVNRPMIERVVEHLGAHGIDEAVLSLGFRPDAFRDAYPDNVCGAVRLRYAVEDQPLDTAGAIRFAATEAGFDRERLVVVNGDVLTDLDITAFLAFHDACGGEASIALHQVAEPSRYGVVPTADDGRVLAFVEKPPKGEAPTDLINAGTYVLEPEALARIDPDGPSSIERVTFPAMADDGVLYAMDGATYWIDAGTPSSYLQAQLDLMDGRRGDPESGLSAGAQLAEGARVARSAIGDGAVVADGAVVTDSVVMTGAVVGRGATIAGSIIGVGAVIGAGAIVRDLSVIGDGCEIFATTELVAARVPEPNGS